VLIVLSPVSPDPLYQQIADQIKEAVAGGELEPGEKLPSIRDLAKALNISVITVKRAYTDLEAEAVIRARPGLGSFVAEIDRARLRGEKLEELRSELRGIVRRGRRFGISTDEIARLIDETEEN